MHLENDENDLLREKAKTQANIPIIYRLKRRNWIQNT